MRKGRQSSLLGRGKEISTPREGIRVLGVIRRPGIPVLTLVITVLLISTGSSVSAHSVPTPRDAGVPFCHPPLCGWVPANVPAYIVQSEPSLYGVAYVTPQSLAVVGFGGTILRSGDGGRNWTVVASPLPGVTMTSLIVLPGGTLLAGGSNGDLIASQNAGVSWYDYYPSGGLRGNVTEMGDTSLSFLYASTSAGLFVSHDAGETWSPMNTPLSGAVNAVGFSSPSDGWIDMGMSAQVYFTGDGGGHWTELKLGISPVFASDIVATGPYSAWVLQYQGYVFSITGGTNSTETDLPTQQKTHQIFADPPYAWIVSDDANNFYTADNGRCWIEESVPSIPEMYAVSFNTPQDGVIAGDGPIWYTTDGGLGSNDSNPCISSSPNTPWELYGAGGLGVAIAVAVSVIVWRSRRGGLDPTESTPPPPEVVHRFHRKLKLRNRKRYLH